MKVKNVAGRIEKLKEFGAVLCKLDEFKDELDKFSELGAVFWFDFCFMTLRHILGHFGRGQLT